ncbi:MAG: prolyl oligopeptidase family serine peptidase [Ferruginibacter sp.]
MKLFLTSLLCILSYLSIGQSADQNNHEIFLNKDSIKSTLDGYTQVFYYYKPTDKKPKPLIVQLHSWSYPADSLKTIDLDVIAKAKNYNYVFPNFRGVNNHPKACCSEFVIADIDECIDWALKNMIVDKKQIYIIGYSGGGYATLSMYMKSRHTIKAFSAWASISDLVAWYGQSVERKNKYAREIISCIGAVNNFDSLKAKERSPLFWLTPVKKRKKSTLQIFAGIHDGHNNAVVPISQSISFYNKIILDYKEKDVSKYVSKEDEKIMLETQTFPASDTAKKIAGKAIHYQKSAKNIMLTIFEGGHDMLSNEALGYIEHKNE